MINNLNKYYKREKFTYWFLSLLPFVFLAEIFLYIYFTPSRELSLDMALGGLEIILVVAGLGLVTYQIISNVRFYRCIKQLPYHIQETVREEMINITKRGRYLLTKDVLIYYGILDKKVYKRSEISRWKRNKGIYSKYVPKAGQVSVSYDNTLIYFKNGYGYMDMIEYPIDLLESEDQTRGELPCNAFLAVFVSIVFTASMIIYPRILSNAAIGTDVERFLIYSSYEVDYCLAAFVITAVSGLASFVIRCVVKPLNLTKDRLATKNRIVVSGILLTVAVMFIAGFIGTWYEDAMLAREDLTSYYAGELRVAEGRYKEKGACRRGEVGFAVYDYAERKSFRPVLLENPGYRLILLKSAFNKLPEEGKIYRVEYLENTKIIVTFSEIGQRRY